MIFLEPGMLIEKKKSEKEMTVLIFIKYGAYIIRKMIID